MSTQDRDYYEVLGISRNADDKAIKNAYHALAMKWHPDRNKSPQAEGRFKEIATAYAILKDPKKRSRYDAQGMEGVAHYTADDLFGNAAFADIFGDMGFGFGGGSIFDRMFGQRAARPIHGQDLRVGFEVPLATVYSGGKENVRISHPATCPSCHGYGNQSGKSPPLCASCQGTGRIVKTRSDDKGGHNVQFQQISVCPQCHGRGTEISEPCSTCGGYGQVEKEETIKLTIPAGVEDGMVFRVPGHGLPGEQPGTPPGDLHVVISTKADTRFQRRGVDLWRSETVDVADAVLGTRITVPTINKKVTVNIPAGTQPDDILRLKGQGLPYYNGNEFGDLNLRIQIHIPNILSKEQRELYEQLQHLHDARR